jgi:hypothetical protein
MRLRSNHSLQYVWSRLAHLGRHELPLLFSLLVVAPPVGCGAAPAGHHGAPTAHLGPPPFASGECEKSRQVCLNPNPYPLGCAEGISYEDEV